MKRFLTKIGTSILALIVLFSSFSFAIDTHYCGDYVVDTAYFGKAKGCGMEHGKIAKSDHVKVTKKNCCKNVTQFISVSEFRKEQVILTKFQFAFLVSFASSYLQLFQKSILKKTFYNDFSPPDIYKNIQVLYQSFLI